MEEKIVLDSPAILEGYLQRWLSPDSRKRESCGLTVLDVCPRIVCFDGFSMSVKASEYSYCAPRNNFGPWSEVEVGFPSAESKFLMPYAEDESCPTETVYGYVPLSVVVEVIIEHGGLSVLRNPYETFVKLILPDAVRKVSGEGCGTFLVYANDHTEWPLVDEFSDVPWLDAAGALGYPVPEEDEDDSQ